MKNTILICLCLILLNPPAAAQGKQDSITTCQFNIADKAIKTVILDTAASGSQIHHPLYKLADSWNELGNTGLPAIPNTYRKIAGPWSPLMFQGYAAYNPTPEKLTFIRVKSPFTLINYNSGGTRDKNGQTINAIYAKNLNYDGNITLTARYIKSDGHFASQANNASFINGNYQTHRKNYRLFLGVFRNSFKSGENGGLQDNANLSGSQPEFLPVNLTEASSKTTILDLLGIQEFGLAKSVRRATAALPVDTSATPRDTSGIYKERSVAESDTIANRGDTARSNPRWKIEHRFTITDFHRFYTDNKPLGGFYPNVYRDSTITKDSVRFSAWRNDVLLSNDSVAFLGRKWSVSAGLKPDLFRYSSDDSVDYGFSLGFAAYGQWRDSLKALSFAGNFTFAGYSAGDYEVTGIYSRFRRSSEPRLRLIVQARGVTADPILRNFYSNHYTWTNRFSRQLENSANLLWSFPGIKLNQNARIILNRCWIYFNNAGLPVQNAGWNAVFELATAKTFRAGPFRSMIRVTVQKSVGEGINLPLVTAGTNTYMHHDIRFKSTGGLLEVEYGFDARFCTAYSGYGYVPATGAFTLQDERKIGNYPYLDAFAMIKVKRTRIFVQWAHALADLLPEQSFGAVNYPYMRPHLKYGVYWHFYD